MKRKKAVYTQLFIITMLLMLISCGVTDPDAAGFSVSDLDIRSLIYVSELNWAGSVDNNGNNNDPDDDYIEISNYYNVSIDISGWSIVISGVVNKVISIPTGTILGDGDYYTIGRHTSGAFTSFNQVDPDFSLPNTGFIIQIKDGMGKVSETVDFTKISYLPGGVSLPTLRKSAIRQLEYFDPAPGDDVDSWKSYEGGSTSSIIRSTYQSSMVCLPGQKNTW